MRVTSNHPKAVSKGSQRNHFFHGFPYFEASPRTGPVAASDHLRAEVRRQHGCGELVASGKLGLSLERLYPSLTWEMRRFFLFCGMLFPSGFPPSAFGQGQQPRQLRRGPKRLTPSRKNRAKGPLQGRVWSSRTLRSGWLKCQVSMSQHSSDPPISWCQHQANEWLRECSGQCRGISLGWRLFATVTLLWMDKILHHLRNPGMTNPLQIPTNSGYSWF